MTIELTMLAWALVLAGAQILAFDLARTAQYGSKWNTGARDATMPPLGAFVGRLQRAQNNLFETLPLFIAAVLIAHVANKDNAVTAMGAQVYLWGRVVYLPLYALGVPLLRTLVWLVSTAGLAAIIYVILAPH
ncbi:MAG: MAPEG family protein [Rhizomicrobium sp.]|jgi:uncharacterized MAPEG superfamily protein